jgi:cytochrome c biogenesis protein CcdA
MLASYLLAIGAGILTMLSPCVLPVIPLVMGSAASANRFGPLALLLGLIVSFTLTGTFATAVLFSLGLPTDILATLGGILLIVVGSFLLFSSLDGLFKRSSTGFSNWINATIGRLSLPGFRGQFLVGSVIGVIWAPCTGPTLGAAIALAAQGENLFQSFLTMLSFSVGAAVPLAGFGLAANRWSRKRNALLEFGEKSRKAMALLFLVIGSSILAGWHKILEAWVLNHLPDWWVRMIASL